MDTISGNGQAKMELQKRLEILTQVAESLDRRRDDLVEAEAEDIGVPYRIGKLELDMAIEHLRTMATEVPHVAGKAPFGTVAAIFPYDAPAVMLARVGGAAVLGGNRFRFSFSSQTPRTARLIAEALRPFPLFQPVVGQDNRRFGQQCIADREIRVLFISGSGAVGEFYARAARQFDKLIFAGPGGMPAVLLFADADLGPAVRFLVRRAFINGGQYCTTIKKAYIHADHYDTVKAAILARMAHMIPGDPRDPDTWIGPIKVERTRTLLARALEAFPNPRFLLPPDGAGEWVGPVILEAEAVPDLELFGPILVLVRVADDRDAVARVQETRYPFAVSYFGTPPAGARQQLQHTFGMVYDNPDFTFTPLRLPFGGKKQSGWILENVGGRQQRRDGAFIYSAELVR